MNIELRNIKYAAFASQETPCYAATVYIDGKKVGTVENDGHGGSDLIHPRELEQQLQAYADTLPTHEFHGMTLPESPESILQGLLYDHLDKRALTRDLKNRFVFTKADGKVYQTKKLSPDVVTAMKGDPALLASKLKDSVAILNLLPFDQALGLYRAGTQ